MESNVKRKSLVGMAWAGIEKCSIQVLRFAFGIVLARLLSPADYGTVGILGVFIALSSLFVDSGFGLALIQKKERTDEDFSTVFYFNLAVAFVAYLILFFAAPFIASFYCMPILCGLCRIMALGLPLGAFCTIQRTRLTVNLDFRSQTVVSIVSLAVSGGVGIYMAFVGYGVWALVWQGLTGSVISVFLLWTMTRWRPRLVFSVVSFKRFFSFGWKHLCSCFISVIYDNVYTLVIGKAFGAAEIGYFSRAVGYTRLAADTVSETVIKVNYPILADLQEDRQRLISTYRKMLRAPMFVLVPLLVGMAVCARPLISVVIGDKWLPCVPYLQVLCIAMIFVPLSNVNLNLLYVKGRTDLVLKLDFVKKPIAFALVLGTIPFGIFWMCVSKGVYGLVAFMLNCYYTGRLLGYGFSDQIKDVALVCINSLLMSVVVWLAMRFMEGAVVKLSIGVCVGVVSYVLLAALTHDEVFLEGWSLVKMKVLRNKVTI